MVYDHMERFKYCSDNSGFKRCLSDTITLQFRVGHRADCRSVILSIPPLDSGIAAATSRDAGRAGAKQPERSIFIKTICSQVHWLLLCRRMVDITVCVKGSILTLYANQLEPSNGRGDVGKVD